MRREKDFAGSSPSLERIFLGLMLLDAQGGPRDRERGQALFADCYLGNDSGVSAAAEEREKSGATKPIDFCADLGGTTLDTNACAEVQHDRAIVDAQEAVKEIFAAARARRRGPRALEQGGARLGRLLVRRRALRGRRLYRGGQHAPRAGDLDRRGATRASAPRCSARCSSRSRRSKEADAELKRAEASARAAARDADNRKLLAAAEVEWQAYRAAEIAFVRRAYVKRYGSETDAARAIDVELARRRVASLQSTMKTMRGED